MKLPTHYLRFRNKLIVLIGLYIQLYQWLRTYKTRLQTYIIYGPMPAFLMKCFALLTLYTNPYKLRYPQSSRDSHITFCWHIEVEYLDFRPLVIFTLTVCMKISICLIPSKIPNQNTHYVLFHSCQHQVKYACFVCCIIPLPSMELVYLPTWNHQNLPFMWGNMRRGIFGRNECLGSPTSTCYVKPATGFSASMQRGIPQFEFEPWGTSVNGMPGKEMD